MKPRLFLIGLAAAGLLVAQEKPADTPSPPPAGAATESQPLPPVPEEKVVVMEPYRVRGNAVGNFAISVQVFIDKDTGKMRLYVSKVAPGSDAERLGLRAGDEIIKIGGHLVADMEPDVRKESLLGQLLLNRRSGDMLELEYVSRQPRTAKLRAYSLSGIVMPRPEPKVDVPVPQPKLKDNP